MSNPRHHHRFSTLQRFLFFDLLQDKTARPVLIYAAGMMIICSLIYHWLEGWSMLDSVYFVVISFTTIGYGDFAPTRPFTKLLTIFLALNGVAVLLLLLGEIQRVRRQQLDDAVAERMGEKEQSASESS